jgi:hypothetical protein
MIFVVAGMHRSGTSMLAALLHSSGISMGCAFRAPRPENPRGFFEDEAFRILNDKILKHSRYEVKQWSAKFDGIEYDAKAIAAGAELIRRRASHFDDWGWKDPRNCLTIDFWLSALASVNLLCELRLVVASRDEHSVAASLLARKNVASLDHGMRLHRLYVSRLESGISRMVSSSSVLRLTYEGLLSGAELPLLETFAARRINTSMMDKSLNHWPASH